MKCNDCGCEFSYRSVGDVYLVKCPQCSKVIFRCEDELVEGEKDLDKIIRHIKVIEAYLGFYDWSGTNDKH